MRILIAAVFAVLALPALAQAPAASTASATAAADPYEGRVPAADQSSASRDRGLREALQQVINRVSGPGADANAPMVVARAPQLVQQYGFDTSNGELQLVARFDKNAVDSQLRAAGLPVWGYSAAPAESADVVISGVRAAADYNRILLALRVVPGVRRVAVLGAEADRVTLTVDAEGGAARLLGALGNGTQFVPDSAASAGQLGLRLVR
jgi:hypothetical protein